ncbi:cleavage and polyadenylation specificity factor subunit 6-like isoform X2 [Durio zibethinus]|nr:cleavage and polyadenylation specificity factor subunit 6-like isoform X2 [Durio zibethinus]XP_022776209.1 cleavage and polyadenylation specificity factor subunit 6-like isoform X2 [Durio zibethinus]XP_022776210.1 cleavage and polyadenylation specificity factor subunit 6-like isoform X2 [Durio zibethinus]
MAEEQIDFGDEEFGGAQKTQYQGSGAIPALADEEMIGEDDEYDDLYNDVNVGEGLLQLQQSEAPPQPGSMGNTGLQAQKEEATEPRGEAGGSKGLNIPGISFQGKYPNVTARYPEQEAHPAVNRSEIESESYPSGSTISQKGSVMEVTRDTQVKNFHGLTSTSQKIGIDPSVVRQKIANDPAQSLNSGIGGPQGASQVPPNQMGMNVNHPMMNENQVQPPIDNGPTMLFVGELHWWTTDAELESVLSQYGRVKEIKFFDERASGKSKGYCQVEFYDSASATACKEGMNGYIFNGRACVVAFASPQTLKQMGASYMNKNQGQPQAQPQGRRPNDGFGRGGNMNFQSGDAGRNNGRGGWARGGQGVVNRGGGPMRGRGGVGVRNMVASSAGVGNGANGAGAYGQGLVGHAFGGPAGGMMPPQGMMGVGFDPTYMGRGGGYGGFPGPSFPGMLPSFPAINTMGLASVAPHVNPAFFGRGMAPNGMGMMGSSGMDGPHAGMWTDTSMGGWGGDEHGRRTRESSYGGEDGASEYGYGDVNNEKGRSSGASREKEQVSEREWSGNSDRRHRDEKERDWDRSERENREHRYREEKDSYREHRHREHNLDYDDDWDRGQSSSRSRSRSHAMPEEERRSRLRDVDYEKKRRLPSE